MDEIVEVLPWIGFRLEKLLLEGIRDYRSWNTLFEVVRRNCPHLTGVIRVIASRTMKAWELAPAFRDNSRKPESLE